MAQSNILLRFRARLSSRGYTNIKIRKCISNSIANEKEVLEDNFGFPLYQVTCNEPLCGWSVCVYASEPQMDNWPGIEFEIGDFSYPHVMDEYDYGDGIFV